MNEQRFKLPDSYDQPKLIEQLTNKFSIKAETTRAEKLTIYDTFDWRLYNKSLVLYKDGHRLLLRRLFDREIIHSVEIEEPPRFVWDLPDGDLKTRLTPIIKMRALLKLADIQTSSTTYRVLNRNEKTVVRVICEELRSLSEPDVPALAAYIWVKPVRGYPKYARQVSNCFEESGLTVAGDDIYFRAVETAGKKPGDYSAKLQLKLAPDMRADEATKVILRHLLATMKANEAGLRADIDTEFLHDFRIAIRRTRSALSQIRNVFPAEITEKFKEDFAYLGRLTNKLRDLDVYLLSESDYRAKLPPAMRDDIAPLFDYLKAQRSQVLNEVIAGLDSEEYARILAGWERFLNESPPPTPPAANAAIPIIELARQRIYKRYRRVVKDGSYILGHTQDQLLHDLRIECKKLRYLMEFFSSLFPRKKINTLIKQLKIVQDNLGDFNDLFVQQEYLLSTANELPITDRQSRRALVAIGVLVDVLATRQQEVKADFAGTFTKFAAPANRKLFDKLFARNK